MWAVTPLFVGRPLMSESEKTNSVSLRSYPRVYYELIFVGFVLIMGMGLSSSFLPILAEELDPSGVLVGLVVSSWFLSRIFIELPGGIISDRVGRRRLLVLGIGLSILGPALCSQARNIYILLIGRTIWGLGTSFYFMNNTALIMDIFSPNIRGRALGTFQGIEFVGSFVGAPIGAFLADFFLANSMGYTQVFYVTLVLMIASFLIALSSKSLKKVENRGSRTASIPIRQIFGIMGNWSIAAICIMSMSRMLIMQGIFQTVFQLYLNNDLLYTEVYIGFVISLRTAGHILAVILAGMLSDRFGRKPILMAGYVISALTLATYPFIRSLEAFFFVGFFTGVGEGFAFTTLMVLLSDIAPPAIRGGAIGLFRTFMSVGGFLGPIIFASIYDGFGVSYAFLAAVVLNVINLVLLVTIKQEKRNVSAR
jgi:MFS family permease